MFAFSTTTIFRLRPQYLASYAAPHPAIPPPTISSSESTILVFKISASPFSAALIVHFGLIEGSPLSILRYAGSCASSSDPSSDCFGDSYSCGGLIEFHGVVLIGNLNSFVWPFLYFIFQETRFFSTSLKTV